VFTLIFTDANQFLWASYSFMLLMPKSSFVVYSAPIVQKQHSSAVSGRFEGRVLYIIMWQREGTLVDSTVGGAVPFS